MHWMNDVSSDYVGSITPPKFQSANLNIWIVNKYSYFCLGALNSKLTYYKVKEPTHMAEYF